MKKTVKSKGSSKKVSKNSTNSSSVTKSDGGVIKIGSVKKDTKFLSSRTEMVGASIKPYNTFVIESAAKGKESIQPAAKGKESVQSPTKGKESIQSPAKGKESIQSSAKDKESIQSAAKGKASPPAETAAGYVMVKASPTTSPHTTGYVKPSGTTVEPMQPSRTKKSMKSTKASHKDTTSISCSEEGAAGKGRLKRKRIIIALILVAVVMICGMIALISYQFAPESGDMITPNEFCQKYVVADAASRHCYYYEDKYAQEDCKKDTYQCISSVARVEFGQMIGGLETVRVQQDSKGVRYHVTKEPNYVPCGEGRWCVRGKCVATSNEEVASYSDMKPEHATYEISCNRNASCSDFSHLSQEFRYNYSRFDCLNKICENRSGIVPQFGFHVATQLCKLPMYGGTPCWNEDVEFPFVVRDICATCADFVDEWSSRYSKCPAPYENEHQLCIRRCDDSDILLPDGYPCETSKKTPGLCFRGYCVAKDHMGVCP